MDGPGEWISNRSKVRELACRLLRPVSDVDLRGQCHSLAAGATGYALAMVQAERSGLLPPGRADQLLDYAVDVVGSIELDAGLWQGYLGVAWLLQFLGSQDDDDPNAETDRVLVADIEALVAEGRYDLFCGLAGVGVYLLARAPRPAPVAGLGLVVNGLTRLAEPAAEGVVWRVLSSHLQVSARPRFPNGYLSTGMAHGAAGVLSFLAALEASPYRSDTSRRLLDQTLAGLFAQRGLAAGARYPNVIDGHRYESGRAVWCHGDLGVAVGILTAGVARNDARLVEEAVTTARDAYTTRGLDRRIVDAGVCHGSAGVAHLYRRIALATDDAICAQAARAWYEKTAADATAALERGPMLFYSSVTRPDGITEPAWLPDRSLLFGSSGVALALLSAIADDRTPPWDGILGVFTPPVRPRFAWRGDDARRIDPGGSPTGEYL